ncbi:MAG: hypothetical protein RLO51_20020 [Thalassobaculum sp.]|uniref:hypothetical protein n=1 Tax=Thalassobaculum sp. TaxID=2022740 RepID=UPI0032EC2B78
MTNPVVINALLQRKAELLADAEKVCDQLDAVYADILHIDATLGLLGHTGTSTTFPRHKQPVGMFYQGELTRLLFEHLRSAGRQTIPQIRDALIAKKGADRGDLHIRTAVHKKVMTALNRQEKRGTVVRDGDAWRVA